MLQRCSIASEPTDQASRDLRRETPRTSFRDGSPGSAYAPWACQAPKNTGRIGPQGGVNSLIQKDNMGGA